MWIALSKFSSMHVINIQFGDDFTYEVTPPQRPHTAAARISVSRSRPMTGSLSRSQSRIGSRPMTGSMSRSQSRIGSRPMTGSRPVSRSEPIPGSRPSSCRSRPSTCKSRPRTSKLRPKTAFAKVSYFLEINFWFSWKLIRPSEAHGEYRLGP